MKFTVVLTKSAHLAGIAAALNRHNSQLPPAAVPLFSDNEFIQHMVERAAERYAQEFGLGDKTGDPAEPSASETLESRLAAGLEAELLATKSV